MKTIILATLENNLEASALQDVLKSEGIDSFIRNAVLSSVFGNISGFQIEILVLEEDYQKALTIYKRGFPYQE